MRELTEECQAALPITPTLHYSSMTWVAGQAIASVDSIHRNIAEGYCRRSIREYIQHLYVAISSLGESVSGYHAYRKSEQLSEEDFEVLDRQAFKLENGLLQGCVRDFPQTGKHGDRARYPRDGGHKQLPASKKRNR